MNSLGAAVSGSSLAQAAQNIDQSGLANSAVDWGKVGSSSVVSIDGGSYIRDPFIYDTITFVPTTQTVITIGGLSWPTTPPSSFSTPGKVWKLVDAEEEKPPIERQDPREQTKREILL